MKLHIIFVYNKKSDDVNGIKKKCLNRKLFEKKKKKEKKIEIQI